MGLEMVVCQSHDYCWFALKRKKKQPCGSATERHSVIQHEVLGTEGITVRHPPGAVGGGWSVVWGGQEGSAVTQDRAAQREPSQGRNVCSHL